MPMNRLGHRTSGGVKQYLLHLFHRIIPVFRVLREVSPLFVGSDNHVYLLHDFPGVLPDLSMEMQLKKPGSSVVADLGISHGLA
jgi:hypothetical protein